MKRAAGIVCFATSCLVAAAVSAQGLERPAPTAEFSYLDNHCSNRGIRVELKESSCLIVDGRSVLAVCEMSVNSPTWRITDEKCQPDARILKSSSKN